MKLRGNLPPGAMPYSFRCGTGSFIGQSALAQCRPEPQTCRSTIEHANHQTTMTRPSLRINYTPGSQLGGGILGCGDVCENSPVKCRSSPGGRDVLIYIQAKFINLILKQYLAYNIFLGIQKENENEHVLLH